MRPAPPSSTLLSPATITQTTGRELALAGSWTARSVGGVDAQLRKLQVPQGARVVADGTGVLALDTVGAWLLHRMFKQLRDAGASVTLEGLAEGFTRVLDNVAPQAAAASLAARPQQSAKPGLLERTGRATVASLQDGVAWLAFVGETAAAVAGCITHPARIRWRPIFFNIRSAGFDALPIVGLLSFLLGIVVAYQAAAQLRRYGANIFVADLVGLSMLREFAPLMTAIIVAGRSGSAYAAQIGTMSVTEEIDAMRTMAIVPQEMLVLPKLVALVIALPLLTIFADIMGTFGGMVMANAQLGVGFADFLDRFAKAVTPTTLLSGVGKAPVFAAIIVIVGCYQGMNTHGAADSVGRQTTRSVVQSIFLVIVADALFSVAFSILDL